MTDRSPIKGGGPQGPLLAVDDLVVSLASRRHPLRLVQGVSFTLGAGETLAIVGESGSGKSLTCHAVAGISEAGLRVSGRVRLDGTDLVGLSERSWNRIRGRRIASIFQNPQSALNPVLPIGRQIAEGIVQHRNVSHTEAMNEAARLLERVKIPAARSRLNAYPHQLSGGMCQRVAIAMAISCGPELLIADEPTTALDVTVQAEIMALLRELQRDLGMAMLLVTHDLGVAAHMADTVLVMYGGRVMEQAPAGSLFAQPRHPYTRGLLRASPHGAQPGRPLAAIAGVVPPAAQMQQGCPFYGRCGEAAGACATSVPPLRELAPRHTAACLNRTPELAAA